jgi:hypothetical protein
MAGYRLTAMAALVLSVLVPALLASPRPAPRPQPAPAQPGVPPAVAAQDLLTIPPQSSPLASSQKNVQYVGHAFASKTAGARTFHIALTERVTDFNEERWNTPYPDCAVGMLLPVCGRIARIQSIDDAITLQLLPPNDLPAGVPPPGNNFPLILGTSAGPAHRQLRVEQIGADDSNTLFVDLSETWTLPGEKEQNTHRETFRKLKVGDVFPLHEIDSQSEYRVAQIIPPDEKQRVVGWITVRPVPDSFRWREEVIAPLVQPRTIVIRQEVRRGNLPPPQAPSLPSFRQGIEFDGKALTSGNPPLPRIQIGIQDRVREHRIETWGYRSPDCTVGMLLPLCGRVGRVKSIGPDIDLELLATEDLPEGVVAPDDRYPMILGVPGNVRLERIGVDASGTLSADIQQFWYAPAGRRSRTGKSELLKFLKVGSTFTDRRHEQQLVDYRVTQIIAPNEKERVPGWITVRPVEGGRRWQLKDLEEVPLPETITVLPDARTHPNLPPVSSALPTFRQDLEFAGLTLEPDEDEPRGLEISTIHRLGFDGTPPILDATWITQYPACEVGLLLPLCGGIGRVEASGKAVRFKMLAGADVPAGLKPPRDDFPLILGAPVEIVRLDRIARTRAGELTVDLTTTRLTPGPNDTVTRASQSHPGLKVGSEFTLDGFVPPTYRITQIVPPDDGRHIVGWITVKPIATGE